MTAEATLDELRAGCTRGLAGHGPQPAARLLAGIPADTAVDRYGVGGVVAELEQETAAVLGAAAAVFLPSGTMAQPATLRVHADRRGRRTVLFHPACHLDRHEGRGYERLHRLTGRAVGDPNRLIGVADITDVAEPVAAVVLELPQRDLGGEQPPWEELVAQVTAARDRGAAVHLDGARLWESAAGYGRPPAEVAALFDTVYVSFYKGLGALAGCCVAGPADVVAEVREWRHRLGGTLFALWPYAASALQGLRERLPRMPAYLTHAQAIAALLREVPGLSVRPDPPQTPMMHLLVRTSPEAFAAAARRLAESEGIWSWPGTATTTDPDVQLLELAVGDATCGWSPDQVRDLVAGLLQPAASVRP